MKYVFFIGYLLTCTALSAADFPGLDARSISLGQVHALSKTSVNPAYLSFQSNTSISVSVCNHFQLNELNTCSLEGMIPNKFLNTGLYVSEFGYEDYQEWTFRSGFSRKLTSRIALGAGFRYQTISCRSDETIQPAISADVGLFFRWNEKFDVALLAEKLLKNSTSGQQRFCAGTNYCIVPSCTLLMEIYSDFKRQHGISAGSEFELRDRFFLRLGVYTSPLTPTFGLSFEIHPFTIEVALDKHQSLGFSSMIGITYHL